MEEGEVETGRRRDSQRNKVSEKGKRGLVPDNCRRNPTLVGGGTLPLLELEGRRQGWLQMPVPRFGGGGGEIRELQCDGFVSQR